MSRATLYVRFPDGEIRYGIYNGTIDAAGFFALVGTVDEAWDAKADDNFERYPEPVGPVEPVEIATDYGGGFHWIGAAARNTLVNGNDPYFADEAGATIDGLPLWAESRTIEGETVQRQLAAPQ